MAITVGGHVIICLCKEVSDRAICQLIEQGVDNFKAMQNLCGVGKGCGRCVRLVEAFIEGKTGLHRRKPCARSFASLPQKEHEHGEDGKKPTNY